MSNFIVDDLQEQAQAKTKVTMNFTRRCRYQGAARARMVAVEIKFLPKRCSRIISCITHIGFAIALSLPWAASILAQEYPHKPIRVLLPFSQGSSADSLMRVLSKPLANHFRQQFIIANRIAVGDTAAALNVVGAPPDGYTWLFTSVNHISNVSLYSKLPYKVESDFAPISLVGNVTAVLVAHSAAGFGTVKDLIITAKAKPLTIKYGSAGVGSGEHLAMETLRRTADIFLTHMPYKDAATALGGVAERQAHVTFTNIPPALPLIREGRLHSLAVSRVNRSPLLPNTPTFLELGLSNSDVQIWFGLLARSGVPRHILRHISSEVIRLVREPEMMAALAMQGMDAIGSSPEEFAQIIRRDLAHIPALLRDAGINAK